ncbi:hypothetical protein [Alteromonas lipotrueae]|jgi:hypothetical protein|uniref:hypothetical protein n=1 Tax=Alteromonas lipotrueae TaxID=2803814 RepID=UPI001C48AC60|nr:hypothetical protein [Alteromonas lipotrueae]
MKPKRKSLFLALLSAIFFAMASGWLVFEVALLFSVGGWFRIWPRGEHPESPYGFALFWGLMVGVLGYPLWQKTGISEIMPSLVF